MQNSDWVYYNDLRAEFTDKLFSRAAKQKHLQDIKRNFKFETRDNQQDTCHTCTNKFRVWMGGMFTNKVFCQFCMNFVCSRCIHIEGTAVKEGADLDDSMTSDSSKKIGLLARMFPGTFGQ